MKNKVFGFIAIIMMAYSAPALAQPLIIMPPNDLPPGAMSYEGIVSGGLLSDPNILASLIGVGGLLVGSLITIFATYFIRWMDVRREDKREQLIMKQNKKEKEYQMKQELYRNFLGELAHLETFEQDSIHDFRRAWTRMEVKVDLVASPRVRTAKEVLQKNLFALAEKNIKAQKDTMSETYIETRDELLDAIREDIDILQKSS